MSGSILLAVAGLWLILQITKGGLITRIGIG